MGFRVQKIGFESRVCFECGELGLFDISPCDMTLNPKPFRSCKARYGNPSQLDSATQRRRLLVPERQRERERDSERDRES